jgi:molybdate transport system substrate-binding protein
LLAFFSLNSIALAKSATIAVANNFSEVAFELKKIFEAKTGDEIIIVTSSTGKLFAQINNGAPFDIFLSADQNRPKLLEENGKAVKNSRVTFAIGRLVLWSADENLINIDGADLLALGNFNFLAIANPELAPYGVGAKQVLENLGIFASLSNKLVMGQNIGQTFSFVASKNAQLGLVAKSYVFSKRNKQQGSMWEVPQNLYDPIKQDGILLKYGQDNIVAKSFLNFMNTKQAKNIIKSFAYDIE